MQRSQNTKLDAIDLMINWKPVSKKLDKALMRTANAVGKPAYPALVLFKGLVMGVLRMTCEMGNQNAISPKWG